MGKLKSNMLLRVILLTLSGCLIYGMSSSIRSNYGVMMNGIIDNSGISFTGISFVLAVGQLVFGIVQPFFGIMGAKKGSASVLVSGIMLMITGMLLIPFCNSILSMTICLGIILPAGTGALSYGIIMGAITPKLPSKGAANVSGIVNASSGIGNVFMSPIINKLILTGGLLHSMIFLSIPMLIMLPIALLLGRNKRAGEQKTVAPRREEKEGGFNTKEIFASAFKSRTYLFLMIGFFTCGFHMAIIMNHLPTEFMSYGFRSENAAYAMSVYGIATILGSLLSGNLCGKLKMKNVLGTFYGIRPIAVVVFIFVPKTMITICAFAALMGFSGASTVPPVAGIVGRDFGARSMATLFGFVFFIHQIGGFLSAWLAGICFEQTGSYVTIWLVDAALCILAAGVSFMIKEEKPALA